MVEFVSQMPCERPTLLLAVLVMFDLSLAARYWSKWWPDKLPIRREQDPSKHVESRSFTLHGRLYVNIINESISIATFSTMMPDI